MTGRDWAASHQRERVTVRRFDPNSLKRWRGCNMPIKRKLPISLMLLFAARGSL